MKRSRSRVAKLIMAFGLALGIAMSTSVPAQAAVGDLTIVRVGNLTAVTGYTVWTDTMGKKHTFYTTAYFSNLTPTSVKLTSFKVCISTGGSVYIRPQLAVWGAVVKNYPLVLLGSGSCLSYYPGMTFPMKSGGELFRIWGNLMDTADLALYQQTVAYFR